VADCEAGHCRVSELYPDATGNLGFAWMRICLCPFGEAGYEFLVSPRERGPKCLDNGVKRSVLLEWVELESSVLAAVYPEQEQLLFAEFRTERCICILMCREKSSRTCSVLIPRVVTLIRVFAIGFAICGWTLSASELTATACSG
jgi:hypothetical protein